MDRHTAGMGIVVLLRVNRPFKAAHGRVKEKGLAAHAAEERTQGKEANDKVADKLHQPGGGFRKSFICEPLNPFHAGHLLL